MKILKDTWQALPPVGKIIVVAGGAFLTYRVGKKLLNKPARANMPQGGAGLPVVSYTPQGTAVYWNPAPLAAELFKVMDGLFTASGTKDDTFLKLAQLPSDDMVTAVYNYFNTKYGDGKSLTDWINSEWWTNITGSGKEEALNRLNTLQLK